MDSYQNGPGGGGVREVDFQRLTQNVGTNIQKILQNGRSKLFFISSIPGDIFMNYLNAFCLFFFLVVATTLLTVNLMVLT